MVPMFYLGRHDEITDAISLLIDSRYRVLLHQVEGWWKDTGRPEDILEANHLIPDGIESTNEGEVKDGSSVVGRVVIEKGTVITGRSVVRGPAIIAENCKIGPNAYIGPYTAVGDRCHLTLTVAPLACRGPWLIALDWPMLPQIYDGKIGHTANDRSVPVRSNTFRLVRGRFSSRMAVPSAMTLDLIDVQMNERKQDQTRAGGQAHHSQCRDREPVFYMRIDIEFDSLTSLSHRVARRGN